MILLDRFIFTWNRPDYDDYISVKWIEIDDVGDFIRGFTLKWYAEVNIPGGGKVGRELSYDFSKEGRFDDAGMKTVWQGEAFGDNGITYDTGKVAFRLNSK